MRSRRVRPRCARRASDAAVAREAEKHARDAAAAETKAPSTRRGARRLPMRSALRLTRRCATRRLV